MASRVIDKDIPQERTPATEGQYERIHSLMQNAEFTQDEREKMEKWVENARANRGESDSWLDRNSWERCISRGMPTAMIPNLYNANYQIFQTPDTVAILVEMIHDVRIIHLDGRPHVSQNIRGWMGDSRGRWEGDTLVVETTNFHDRMDGGPLQPSHVIQTGYRGSGETMKLVERFTRIDANTIEQGFRVKHNGTPELHFYVYATFKKEADGEWRLTIFELADPVNVKDKKDLPVP